MVPTPFTEADENLTTSGTMPFSPINGGLEVQSITAVTPRTFSYGWVTDAKEHVVYRDGMRIAGIVNGEFSDDGLVPGHTYTYKIESYRDGDIVSTRVIPVEALSVEGAETAAGQRSLLARQNWVSQAVYRTFIADNRVSLDNIFEAWGCGQFQNNRSFGGDNRGFATPLFNTPWDRTSYRTSVFLNVNWDNPAPYNLVWVKDVGTTRLYEGSTHIASRTASDTGIIISDVYATGSYAQARVKHNVGNPFCHAGEIAYDVVFRWHRSGIFEVIGWRRPVPHHEIYGGWDTGFGFIAWREFGRFTNEGFHCLAGFCGTRIMNIVRGY